MPTEDQKQTKQISSGYLSSVLLEIQKIITEFKDEMLDYVVKVLQVNLPPSTQAYDQVPHLPPVDRELDPEVQHVPPALEQIGAGVPDLPININKDITSGTNRDASSFETSKNIGSPKLIRTLFLALKF